MTVRFDLHTHSSVSDGTDAPAELVRKASEAGLAGIALTDHDTFDGLDEAKRAGEEFGVDVLAGLEFSTERGGASVHLLGYGCDPSDGALNEELARVREGRTGRVPGMVARLGELGTPITVADVLEHVEGTSPGRPHVADALVAHGYARDRDEAFTRWLHEGGPAWVDRYSTALPEAIALVRGAGGVAVLAHPWSRGRRADLPPEVLAELAQEHGLDGLEVDHPDHDAATRAELRDIAGRLGLLVTGSSDHHGLGKSRNPLGAHTTAPGVRDAIVARSRARGGRP